MALIVLTFVSVACVALLFIERRDLGVLQQNFNTLRQENTMLRSQLDDYRNGLATQQEAAARLSD